MAAVRTELNGPGGTLAYIHKKLAEGANRVGCSFSLQSFPWSTMLIELARNGIVLVNYPEDVPLPGEERELREGVGGFTDTELTRFVSSFNDSDPLTFLGFQPFREALMDSTIPVLTGVCPRDETRGPRCKFVNGTTGYYRRNPHFCNADADGNSSDEDEIVVTSEATLHNSSVVPDPAFNPQTGPVQPCGSVGNDMSTPSNGNLNDHTGKESRDAGDRGIRPNRIAGNFTRETSSEGLRAVPTDRNQSAYMCEGAMQRLYDYGSIQNRFPFRGFAVPYDLAAIHLPSGYSDYLLSHSSPSYYHYFPASMRLPYSVSSGLLPNQMATSQPRLRSLNDGMGYHFREAHDIARLSPMMPPLQRRSYTRNNRELAAMYPCYLGEADLGGSPVMPSLVTPQYPYNAFYMPAAHGPATSFRSSPFMYSGQMTARSSSDRSTGRWGQDRRRYSPY